MNRKLLRTLGIALIVFPEPTFVFDVIGLLLIGTYYLLSRGKKPDSYEQLRELVKSYLGYMKGGESENYQPVYHTPIWSLEYTRTSPAADSHDVWLRRVATEQIILHTLDRRRLLGSYRIIGSFDPESQHYYWHDEPKTEKVVYDRLNRRALLWSVSTVINPGGNSQGEESNSHHMLERRTLFDRSQVVGTFNTDSQRYLLGVDPKPEKVVHHTINESLLLNRRKVTGNFNPGLQHYEWRSEPIEEEIVYHKLNRALIPQYGRSRHRLEPLNRQCGQGELAEERVIHHTLNRSLISQYNQAQVKNDEDIDHRAGCRVHVLR